MYMYIIGSADSVSRDGLDIAIILVIVIPCPRGLYGIYCLSPRVEPEGEGNKSHAARGGVV